MKNLRNETTRSQCSRLLKYLQENEEGLTTYQAFSVLKICRISARIKDLREKGYNIKTIMHHKKRRDGSMKIWGQYILIA